MQRILLVEDSIQTQMIVKVALGNDFNVTCTGQVNEAEKILNSEKFDLIILDVALPDGNGLKLYENFSSHQMSSSVPVVFLTGNDTVTDKVNAFNMGAEDYIVKPFDPQEFRARIQSKIFRRRMQAQPQTKFNVGPFVFDIGFQRISVVQNNKEDFFDFTPAEFKLLYFLASNQGKLFSVEQLLEVLWAKHTHVSEQNIYTHISSARRKLGPFASWIASVPKNGYSFRMA